MMKNKLTKYFLITMGIALAVYPATFLLYVFSNFESFIRYVGTEYDALMAFTWLFGILIFLALTMYDKGESGPAKSIFKGVISAYAVSAALFSHQHALLQFNEENIFLRGITIVIALVLIILLIKEYLMKRSKEIKKTYEADIAVLSLFYYGFSLVLLNFILNSIFDSNALHSLNIMMYFIWILSAAAGVLCLGRRRQAFILTIIANFVNVLIYIALIVGTVYFGENIAEALQGGIPGLFISVTLITCSLKTLRA